MFVEAAGQNSSAMTARQRQNAHHADSACPDFVVESAGTCVLDLPDIAEPHIPLELLAADE